MTNPVATATHMRSARVFAPGVADGGLPSGLTTAEVEARRLAGQTNAAALPTSRSYVRIVRDNVFTFINGVLFGLAVALIALGRGSDALVSVGVVAVNMTVGLVQEIHAKLVLDRIAVLTRPDVTVIRDGLQQRIDPTDVVLGDLLVATAGDQIAADGVAVGNRSADVDEALLTGESDVVPKQKGDRVFAGTFCAAGSVEYVAQRVGADSTANQLATSARAFRRVLTPLQDEMNRVVRVSLALVVFFEILVALSNALDQTSLVESVRTAVVIAGLIPNGLFLAIAVAYAMGAVRIAGKGALVQQANAVESLSHVDVLCLDKTGTLTTNRFKVAETLALRGTEAEFRSQLGSYAASSSDTNRTLDALREAFPAVAQTVVDEVLFSSAHKWSALTLAESGGPQLYVLGAPDILESHLRAGQSLPGEAQTWVSRGYRLLLLARACTGHRLQADGNAHVPDRLDALGVVALSDELRHDAARTLAEFAAVGVQLRLLSGDDPRTVAALALQAGMSSDAKLVSGPDLAGIDPASLIELLAGNTIFGRVTPAQKEMLVNSLRARGKYVAMIGDGVNDVLALKAADLAIAMQSGTAAARAVADMVLLKDNFGALPFALHEGQRIRGGMHAILKLFLTRVLYMALLIVMLAVVDIGFPFAPKQNALVTLLTVGLPTLALAAWARPMEPREHASSVFHFVVPAACALAVTGFSVYIGYLLLGPVLGFHLATDATNSPESRSVARTALTTLSILCGLLLIMFVQPHGVPVPGWRGVNWRHLALGLALAATFAVIAVEPRLREVFELQPLTLVDYVLLTFVAALWALVLRGIWRWRLLERVLGIDPVHGG
ncbi:MAG TPA: HAD-IC family P-type ATPase [Ktedonobacterales bacterium]|nr:HAD-IC family P-type ATPase [Ktedonobacterales bacterium]